METTQFQPFSTAISDMTTSNSSVVDEDDGELFPHSLAWNIAVGIVYCLIIVITLIGNAFVMAAYKVDERIRARPSNLLILNLSISDFLVGITLIFNYVFLLYDIWPLGEIPCKLWTVLDYTCSYMSVITITLISLDRYWMVKKKLGYRKYQTKKRILITLAISWSVVFSFYTITAFGYGAMTKTNYVDFSDDCEMEYLYNLAFSSVMIIVEFAIPFCIIIYLNVVVFMNIRMRTGGLVRSKPDKGPNMSTTTDADKSIGTDSASGLAYSSNPLYTKKPVPIVTISYMTKDDVATPSYNTESTDEKLSKAYEVDDSIEESKASDEGIVTEGANIASNSNGFSNPILELNDVDVKTESRMQVELNSENTNNNANHGINGSNDGKLKVQETTRPLSGASLNSDGHTTISRAKKEQAKKNVREFRRQRRAAIVLFTLVTAFAICWLPYQITTILTTIMDGSVHFIVDEVMTNLLWCNSTINPFLYAFVTMSFRRNFLRFLGLHRVTCCNKKTSSGETQDRVMNTSDPTEGDS